MSGLLALPWPLLALLVTQTPAPPGPGKCSEEQFLRQQMNIVKWCREPEPSCPEPIACHIAMRRSTHLYQCRNAKWLMATLCFDGGNDAQKQEIKRLEAKQETCEQPIERHTCTVYDDGDPGADDPRDQALREAAAKRAAEAPSKPEPTIPAPPPVPLNLAPPGDCTKELFKYLDSRVGELCKSEPMSCKNPNLDCPTLKLYIGRFEACIQTRRLLMETCFRGGDERHQSHLQKEIQGRARCLEQYLLKCGPDPRCRE